VVTWSYAQRSRVACDSAGVTKTYKADRDRRSIRISCAAICGPIAAKRLKAVYADADQRPRLTGITAYLLAVNGQHPATGAAGRPNVRPAGLGGSFYGGV
jgi:hypothetical protein